MSTVSTGPCPIRQIIKRNGRIVEYNRERIATAILKALTAEGRADRPMAERLAAQVEDALVKTYTGDALPSVEDIQKGLGGNLCRCGTYAGIQAAVLQAAGKGGPNA